MKIGTLMWFFNAAQIAGFVQIFIHFGAFFTFLDHIKF